MNTLVSVHFFILKQKTQTASELNIVPKIKTHISRVIKKISTLGFLDFMISVQVVLL